MASVGERQGNRFGIGSTVVIRYRPYGGLHQMRELQASGGFVSYDAPVAHFGLGRYGSVSRIDIIWSNGEKTTLDRPFPAGYRYVVRHQAPAENVRPATAQSSERPPR